MGQNCAMCVKSQPKNAKGVGTVAAPRGANAHWIVIKDGKIDNYQCIVPTTWNGSPRDPTIFRL
jgi:hydrogenase large subunit